MYDSVTARADSYSIDYKKRAISVRLMLVLFLLRC